MNPIELEQTDRDERLGEAVEEYLALSESGTPPDPEQFAARYPDLGEDLVEALEGLSLVRGLVGARGDSGWRRAAGWPDIGSSASWVPAAWGSSMKRFTSIWIGPSR